MTTGLRVLAIDTSTEACSAALLQRDGTALLRFVLTERSHADLILPMVNDLLEAASLKLTELDGLAFGRGPGGFTGLRVAAGVIQGMAYGAKLRVAPVSSLAAVAYQVLRPAYQHPATGMSSIQVVDAPRVAAPGDVEAPGEDPPRVLVCNDARMSEVYWACFAMDPAADIVQALTPERVSAPAEVDFAGARGGQLAGNGLARYPDLRARLAAEGWRVHDDLYPRADAIARMGAAMLQRGEFVPASGAVPVYVRDNVARPSVPGVTGMS